MEDVLSHFIQLLTKGEFVILIISFIKTLLLTINYDFPNSQYQNIKDIMLYVSSIKSQLRLKEDEMVDINLILSYINSKF
jgi:hypothetical protein